MRKSILFLCTLPIFLTGCQATSQDKNSIRVSKQVFGCDTLFDISAYGVSKEELSPLEEIVLDYSDLFNGFEEIPNVNNIYTINNTNNPVKVNNELYQALKKADEFYKNTDGYFNPYLGELTYEYKRCFLNQSVPSETFINEKISALKEFTFEFDDANLTVKRNGSAKIDLGAFAKGYVIDVVKEKARELNIEHYYVSGGSSSTYFTSKYNGDSYKAGIKYLPGKGMLLKDSSIGISAIFEQNIVIDNKVYSHIINPFTGKSSTHFDFSIVKAESATLTDVFSTVLMIADDSEIINKFAKEFSFSYKIYKDEQVALEQGEIEMFNY